MDKNNDFELKIAKAFDFEPSPSVDRAIHAAITRRAWFNRRIVLRPLRIAAAAAILLLVGATLFLSSSPSTSVAAKGVSVAKVSVPKSAPKSAADDQQVVAMAESLLEVQGLADDDFLCSDLSDQSLM